MARYTDTLRDQNLRPIAGALVSVTDISGGAAALTSDEGDDLPNPLATDAYGTFIFNTAPGPYTLSFRYGGRLVFSEVAQVGAPLNAAEITIAVEATAADRTATAADRIATAADRVATGEDRAAAEGARDSVAAKVFETWAELSALDLPDPYDDVPYMVLDSDSGTHTDPVTDEVGVPNGGLYKPVDPDGWKRIGDTTAYSAGLAADAAAASAAELAEAVDDIAGLSALFDEVTSTNTADPATTDDAFATIADQLHRVWQAGSGVLSAQDSSGLGKFAALKRYALPFDDGDPFVMHIDNANGSARITLTGTPRLIFFDEDGEYLTTISTGFTVDGGDTPVDAHRSVEVAAKPAGAAYVALNVIRNDRDAGTPMTGDDVENIEQNLMIYAGTTRLGFEPFVPAGTKSPDPEIFYTPEEGPFWIMLSQGYAYALVAAQQSTTNKFVYQMRIGEEPDYTAKTSGIFDIYGVRGVPIDTAPKDMILAFLASDKVVGNASDMIAPIKMNGHYIGARHGIDGFELTGSAHGKDATDAGQILIDAAARSWKLLKAVDSTHSFVAPLNTGASDEWVMSVANAPVSPLTYVSGGTHTGNISFTGTEARGFFPILQSRLLEVVLDGIVLTTDGVPYNGAEFHVRDNWYVPNAASWPTVDIQHKVWRTYRLNRYGAWSISGIENVVQGHRRSAPPGAGTAITETGDYSAGFQVPAMPIDTDETPGMGPTRHLYAPGFTGALADYTAIKDVTANASFVGFPASLCVDPANPTSHFVDLVKDDEGNIVCGQLFGYSRLSGMGKPSRYAANVAYTAILSPQEKTYTPIIDYAAGDAVAGEVYEYTYIWAPFLATDDTLTVPALIATDGDKDMVYITAHSQQGARFVGLPAEMDGKPAALIDASADGALYSERVRPEGVMVGLDGAVATDVIVAVG